MDKANSLKEKLLFWNRNKKEKREVLKDINLTIKNGDQDAQVLYINSRALNEPVAWAGPIVMNTQEELQKAFSELRNNTFIKEKAEY